MAVKVYLPTDSKQVFFDDGVAPLKLVTANQARIYSFPDETILIKDELKGEDIVDKVAFGDIQNEAGAAWGATLIDTLKELSKFIG